MKSKNILMFASCNRSFNEQKNVYNSLRQKNCRVIFLYSTKKTTQYPSSQTIENFNIDCNFEIREDEFRYEFESIGMALPFIPDIVIVSRESWLPETVIIDEFKRAGSIITCIENSSWLYNNIKTRLEILSRFRYPTNLIDVFFEHSDWCLKTKEMAGWITNKSVIVGVPKFDNLNSEKTDDDLNYIIIYGSMEQNIHPKIIDVLREIKSNEDILQKYRICYKPHPKEFEDFPSLFSSELLKDIIVIDKEESLQEFVSKSVCNIGIFSSVMMYPLLNNKKILYIDEVSSGILEDMDFKKFEGHEYEFWKNIINVNSFDDFKSKIGEDRVSEFLIRYSEFIQKFKSSTSPYSINSITSDSTEQNYSEIVKYFDEYNDGNASERIANYLILIFN